ncbi:MULTISPECIES: PIG-L deacetylase family protein [unclassified Microbacterium]|uniref:PIG-L deacetylase family protein n=1 Tax=unclassified Microbacterium TaxID=2609290 RepID=UPI003650AEA1
MNKHLKILVVVAHPDEAEEYASGTLSLLADRGHHIKVLCTTNGDAGHMELGPEELVRRRLSEGYAAAEVIGLADYEVWDEHDGDMVDSQELRQRMLRAIRQWRADVIITFTDEGAGHNDNRLAGRLVRHVTGLTTLPNPCREVPPLAEQPVVLQMIDYGSIDRHRADVAVNTTPVIDRKLRACAAHATQFLEFAPAQRGLVDLVPDPDDIPATDAFIVENWREYIEAQDAARAALRRVYGADADAIRYAETFDLAPYGRTVTVEDVDALLHG